MTDEPERLRDLLDDFGGRLGMGSAAGVGKVWAHWRGIVGPAIADHADPTSLRDGILRVRADSPAWSTEIGYLGTEIKSRINAAVGSALVTEVRIWIGPRVERGTGRRPLEDEREPRRPRVPADDPEVALERAKKAWSRSVGRGSTERASRGRENQEKRR